MASQVEVFQVEAFPLARTTLGLGEEETKVVWLDHDLVDASPAGPRQEGQ